MAETATKTAPDNAPGMSPENAPGMSPENAPGMSLAERLRSNPVIVKELRGRMRGFRAFLVLTLYLLALGGLVGLVYLLALASNTPTGSADLRQSMGKIIFGLVVMQELMAACFIAPGLTAGAISSERERQTFDLLRTTLLPARSVVLGKFMAAFFYLLLLIFAALPIQSLAFLFGGVSLEEVGIAALMLVVTAMTFCSVGLFFSSMLSRTLVSTVLAYAFAILWVFGLPFILSLFSGLLGTFFTNTSPLFGSLAFQKVIFTGGWLLISLNPLGAAVVSEVVLLTENSLFLFNMPLPNGGSLSLISPWIIYVIISLLASLLLLWLSVRHVRRAEK